MTEGDQMQRECPNCHIHTAEHTCPLCRHKFVISDSDQLGAYYPIYEEQTQYRRFAQRLVFFIALIIMSTSILINLLINPETFWFLYLLGPVLYIVLLINHTILSQSHIGSKVVLQVIAMSVALFLLDLASGASKWSIHYVIPFVDIVATLLVTVIVLMKPMRWSDYIGYMMTMIVLGFIPIILFLSTWSVVLWPSAITALYAFLTLVGMLFFSEKTMKNEIVRRFHF